MSSRRKISPLWNHFVEEDGKKGKCKYCSDKISFTSGSLGNFSRHLKRKHHTLYTFSMHHTISTATVDRQLPVGDSDNLPEPVYSGEELGYDQHILSLCDQHNEPSTSVSAIKNKKSCTRTKIDLFSQRPLSQSKKAKIDQQLLIMIAKEYHPLSLVNDPEFRKFVELLNPSYSLPTRKTLSESLLPQKYLELKQLVRNDIAKALAVCITTDGWTSENNESFIAITAHYIDPEVGKLCANLLGCINFEKSHTAANLCQLLKEELKQWQIEKKVDVIVSDNAAIILAAVQAGEWKSVPCFADTLNLIVQAGIQAISGTLKRMKRIVEYFQRNKSGLNKLKSAQKQMNLEELKLKQDVSTRWNSTYQMLDRAVRIKEALITTLALVRPDLALSPEDWIIIISAVPILKVFYEVTVEVSTEKWVSLSKVIVYCRLLMRQISNHLSQAEAAQENDKICSMLRILVAQLHRRFDSVESNVLYAECTILDPRFKGKGFRNENNYKRALEALKNKVSAMRLPTPEPSNIKTIPTMDTPSLSKGPSIWNDFDQEVASLVPENTSEAAIIELENYIQEPIINRLEDPLLWWHNRKSIYPLLYEYVLNRLNIVATSVPCERIFSKAGLTLTNRRRRVKATKVSMLLFIGCNYK